MGLQQLITPQFLAYLVITITAFVMCLGAIEYFGIPPTWAFAGGFLFSLPVEILRDKAQATEKEVQGGELADV